MKTTFIYTLSDRDGHIRYVGKANDPQKRFTDHIYDKKKTHKSTWIRSLGYKPILEILDEIAIDDWQFWEMYWIAQCKAWGHHLTNHTNGGEGVSKGNVLSDEHKRKLSEALSGEKHPMYGKKHTPLSLEKMSKARIGFTHTDDAKQKISIGNKGKKLTYEQRKRMSDVRKGKTLSKEHRENLSKSHLGNIPGNTGTTPVGQYSLNGVLIHMFPNLRSVGLAGFTKSNVLHVINGKRPHHRGFVWRYIRYEQTI